MEKITLTQAQVDAITSALKVMDVAELLDEHAGIQNGPQWTGHDAPMNDLSQADMARALLIGYEVELEYKVGDWVFHLETLTTSKIIAIGEQSVQTDNGYNFSIYRVRHATPEEIKAEQERQVWAKIGRGPGEFRDGDFAFSGDSGYHSHDAEHLRDWYLKGKLKGFFPTESFISFGGDE